MAGPMTGSNEQRIKEAQAGSRTAFAELIDAHYEQMFRFACKFCGNRMDAEDITQQACIKLAKHISQYRFEAAFSSWLYRLVINCGRDFYKTQQRGLPRDADDRDISSFEQTATDRAETSVLLHQVMGLVEGMGEGYRETVALVIGEGLSHAEAAAILQLKESTVSWRLHEIRKRLDTHLHESHLHNTHLNTHLQIPTQTEAQRGDREQ